MINIRMQNKEVPKLSPKIIVIGVGGAGGNAVNNMIGSGLEGVEFLVCNTDAQMLGSSLCEQRVQLGEMVTGGLGAGARPEVGKESAEESLDSIMAHLDGANMVFITAGMGGGTGTGAAPVIAKAARERGILTIGVVTKPFLFEGTYRMKMAEAGIDEMQDYVDTLIVIPNQNLFRIANEKTTFTDAFQMADGVLQSAVRGVTDLMVRPGHINLDFADIRSVMREMGKAMMGTGEAVGEDRAEMAAQAAINNPLLDDVSLKGARGVIINVTGGHDMTLFEVDAACNLIRDEVDPNANIIIGSTFDESMEGLMRVSVVATGIDAEERARKPVGAGGTSIWNTRTTREQGERRLERAQPQSQSQSQSPSQPLSGMAAAQIAPASVTAPAPVAAPSYATSAYAPTSTAAAPRRMEDVAVSDQSYAVSQQTYQAEPTGKKFETAGGTDPMRASIYNDSFIPPKPVEVADAPRIDLTAPQQMVQHAPQQMAQQAVMAEAAPAQAAAQAPVQAPVMQSASGLNLRPPVPGAGTHNKPQRRTASLFERITSPLRQLEEAVVDSITDHRTRQEDGNEVQDAPDSGSFHSGLRAPTRPQEQGSLNIDVPQVKNDPMAEDELDIPAFLRRQAN